MSTASGTAPEEAAGSAPAARTDATEDTATEALLIKRAYEAPAAADGYRVLVDRLWPRGVSKDHAELDAWLKDIAPSPPLRTWWHHDPARLAEFAERYRAELDDNPAVAQLEELLRGHRRVTLVYGARDPVVNHAAVLSDYLRAQERGEGSAHA